MMTASLIDAYWRMQKYTLLSKPYKLMWISRYLPRKHYQITPTLIIATSDSYERRLELLEWRCQTNEPKHQYLVDGYFYEITKERHSVRAASRLSLNVLRFESDLCELNRLWNEAWMEANFCRLCMRLNRSMALSRRRMGKCEFSTLLIAHLLVTCFSAQPNSRAAAL